MNAGIFIQVLSPLDLSNSKWAERLFLPLLNSTPSFKPKKINNFEPLRKRFSSIEDVSEIWNNPILWKSMSPRSSGQVDMDGASGPKPIHDGIILHIEDYRSIPQEAVESIFCPWSLSCQADIGYIQLLTEPDLEPGRACREVFTVDQRIPSYGMYWTTHTLRKYLPNIHWGMVFGSPYIDLFGREKLLSAPAHRVWETPSGQIFLQLTSSLFDLEHDYEHVHKTRERVKEHLGADAFYKPRRSTYHAPRFEIQHREVAPAIDPQRALEALKSNLQDRVSAALTAGKLHWPLAARMDKRERLVNHELQQAILLTKTEEDIVTDIERTFKIEALTVSIAGGIARPTSHSVGGRTVSAIQMHLEHESGYSQNLLFTYNQPFDGFKDCISLEPQPYIYERHARKI
ncbi:hypothetical protein G6O69_33595 [Pseudenhygromyxa sp. WMMC2535]|uniref:hypothetical protein n=1 Tax=Pseudenhygromyxa sp. WMMC2535 TaxID=2712867 RepID=UPI0015570694|nr:hypothetical protein [Pseudenhygromyxa sp. WMMC2535]NVB42804.1 hypothetical protein [Pseudenhygromyxa sp. WMMC2535]